MADAQPISPRFDARIAAANPEKPFRLGILGGTFDPVHNGHMALAQAAYAAFGLDGVLFIPTGLPVRKMTTCYASALERYAMLDAALAGIEYFDISRIEIDREGPTYTIDTLLALDAAYGKRAELFFIGGGDIVDDLQTWKNAAEIAKLVTVICARRGGYLPEVSSDSLSAAANLPDTDVDDTAIDGFEAIAFRVYFFEMPRHTVSSTEIRTRVKLGLSVEELMPDAARRYMRKRHLYE